tara:strand:- start:1751 stop:2680 length:930 start_codon:yes stop_codon:yes gene_type:complete
MFIANFKKNRKAIYFFKFVVVVFFFFIIFKKIDLYEIIKAFSISIETLLYLLCISLFLFFLSSKRLSFLYLGKKKLRLLFWLRLHAAASIFNLIIPARLGDFSKYYLIKKDYRKYPKSYLLGMFIFERSLDLIILIILLSIMYTLINYNYFFYFLSGLIFFLFYLFIKTKIPHKINYLRLDYFSKLQKRISKFLYHFNIYKEKLSRNYNIFKALVITLLFWLFSLIQINTLIDIFNDQLLFLDNSFLIIKIILISLIPITFSGLGTREFFFIYFFGPLIGNNEAFVVSIYFYIFRYLFPAILGLFFVKK